MRYPRYNASILKEGVEVEVNLKFINKEQLREVVEDYHTMKGYDNRKLETAKDLCRHPQSMLSPLLNLHLPSVVGFDATVSTCVPSTSAPSIVSAIAIVLFSSASVVSVFAASTAAFYTPTTVTSATKPESAYYATKTVNENVKTLEEMYGKFYRNSTLVAKGCIEVTMKQSGHP
ncbi:hypothetical protein Cgig2_000297 [Carnegiea gigantea]|uniref:Uncharacterized protein n=1 Tax=Carnegiea gigantea TaxID=171969 RepID=A0A9Q1QBS3_9CARY|nr:hypothetical protein Cgig2_000297 [Carnegiea gigantea]